MRSMKTKRAIVEAAAEEFVSRGYAGASMSAIADRLGLTKGALTYHFPAKGDFVSHFVGVVRRATCQADAFAKEHFPDNGSRRLLLYFLMLSSWRRTRPQLRAGMALLVDSAAGSSGSDEIIHDWLALSLDAFEKLRECGDLDPKLTPAEAAELFLFVNLGASFFGGQVWNDGAEADRLRVVGLALTAVGVEGAKEEVDEIIADFGRSIPALDCD